MLRCNRTEISVTDQVENLHPTFTKPAEIKELFIMAIF
jgi:hypothetical protein